MAAFLNWRMSRGNWATFDAILSDTIERFLATLGPVERQEFYRALDVLLQDPYPDGAVRRSVIQCYLDDEALLLR